MSQVRNAGYLSRKLSLLNITANLDREVEDCGSTDYLEIDVETKDVAKRFTNRFYKLKHTDKKLKEVRTNTDELIGKKILFRSTTKCRLTDGNFCKTCYGHLADINQFHVGLIVSLLLGNQIIQRLLSSKHLLQVSADKIELPDGMDEFFDIDKNIMIAKKPFKLTINEYSDDENAYIPSVSKFTVYSEDMEEPLEFDCIDMEIFDEIIKDNLDESKSVNLLEGEEVFKFTVENNEISAPLKKLLNLIENEKELNSKESIEELVLSIIELLDQSGIRISATGIEIIVKGLSRDPNNYLEDPKNFNDVYFLRLTNAIINSRSLAVSLAFERLKQQVETNAFDKFGSSVIDGAF